MGAPAGGAVLWIQNRSFKPAAGVSGLKFPGPKKLEALFGKNNDCKGYENNPVNDQIEEPGYNNIDRIQGALWDHRIGEHGLYLRAVKRVHSSLLLLTV